MEKRSINTRERELEEENEDVVKIIVEEQGFGKEDAPTTRKLRLMKNVKLKYVGRATGNLYVFERAGHELDVDIQDADEMLAKRSNRQCCPGSGIGVQTPYFEEVR